MRLLGHETHRYNALQEKKKPSGLAFTSGILIQSAEYNEKNHLRYRTLDLQQ